MKRVHDSFFSFYSLIISRGLFCKLSFAEIDTVGTTTFFLLYVANNVLIFIVKENDLMETVTKKKRFSATEFLRTTRQLLITFCGLCITEFTFLKDLSDQNFFFNSTRSSYETIDERITQKWRMWE